VPGARCLFARAETALVSRQLAGWPATAPEAARATPEELIEGECFSRRRARRPGEHHACAVSISRSGASSSSPASGTAHELLVAGMALHRFRTKTARCARFQRFLFWISN
jgi:hypothetical protein